MRTIRTFLFLIFFALFHANDYINSQVEYLFHVPKSTFEIFYNHFLLPGLLFAFLLVGNINNTILSTKNKIFRIILTIVLMIVSAYIHNGMQADSCETRCDFLIGYPFPIIFGPEGITDAAWITIFILGSFLNFTLYYLLLSSLRNIFKNK